MLVSRAEKGKKRKEKSSTVVFLFPKMYPKYVSMSQ